MSLVAVSHSFESRLFVPITHTFTPGQITGIIGPSGCGKSTLLAIIAGMVVPTEGAVERDMDSSVWVFQNPHGVPQRSALDHVTLPLLARGLTRRQAEAEGRRLLVAFGLDARAGARFSELSGGEAQRLMLARAAAASPALLLIDEPTAQLDREMAEQVNAVIRRLAGRGAAIAIATHDARTRAACDEILDLGAAPEAV